MEMCVRCFPFRGTTTSITCQAHNRDMPDEKKTNERRTCCRGETELFVTFPNHGAPEELLIMDSFRHLFRFSFRQNRCESPAFF